MSLPSTIALTQPTTDSPATSADQRNDHTAIQTAVNGLIGYLAAFTPGAGGLTGTINADATTAAGSGFTCVHTATGEYTITFTTPFSVAPLVVVTGVGAGFTSQSWGVSASTTGVVVYGQTGGIGPTNQAFNFYAAAMA